MTKYLVKFRYWLLGITLAFAAVCFVLLFHVNINTDMSKYLPDDSNMRAGLEIMNDEFEGLSEMGGNDVRVMFKGLSEAEKGEKMVALKSLKQVSSVMELDNGDRTLYELGVSSAVDQVELGEQIAEAHPEVEAVETSQDGATAEVPMLLGGVGLLLIILFAMCRSWLEPVLFLASTGIAVLLNVGTNAFLPSVSVTTNSIVAILQLVLSMDYSIILLNHFRQDKEKEPDSVLAMQKALKRASSPIISSALTTIVGLIMLVFMKLKIGADMGIVLSKGVFCSLICNFTVLPSLILLFEKGIHKSAKKVFVFPTDKLAGFCSRYRIALTLLFVVVFAGSFILKKQTEIIFYKDTASQIEQYFPKKNPVVLIYDNKDEGKVVELVDSLMQDTGVEMVISYPSLLLREYTAPQMLEAITDLTDIMGGMGADEVPDESLGMLTPEVMQVLYYAAHSGNKVLTMEFNEMADFILEQANDPNSLIAQQLDEDMMGKIKLLDELRHSERMVPTTTDASPKPKPNPTDAKTERPVAEKEQPRTQQEPAKSVENNTFIAPPTPEQKSQYTDLVMLNTQMTHTEMAAFLNMDASQAKMVYKLAQRVGKTMTPYQFVHFLTDDVLKRKVLSAMIKTSEKKQLIALQQTMDSAVVAANRVKPNEMPAQNEVANTINEDKFTDNDVVKDTVSPQEVTPQPVAPQPVKMAPLIPSYKSNNDKLFKMLDELMYAKKQYTSEQMAQNIAVFGETIPKEMLDLLYLYYAGTHDYDSTWTMSLKQIVDYLSDNVIKDPRFAAFIDDEMRAGFEDLRVTMDDGVGKLRSDKYSLAMIITNYETESPATYQFVDHYYSLCNSDLDQTYYSVGESIMLSEMKAGFHKEVWLVTLLTIAAIFLIVALTFRSLLLSAILVITVMSGVFVNVVVSGFGGSSLLYIAYLVVQSILMGAAIDYGILFANYYRNKRVNNDVENALKETYRCSTHTILTSGLILILVPGIMSILVSDMTISNIVKSISIGALATVLLILFVLPGVLAFCDKIIAKKK